jgi:hypothetical protein
MGYATLIEKNLDLAFVLLGDLVSDMLLLRKNAPTFNFGTGVATTTALNSESVRGIFTTKLKSSKDRNVNSRTLYINTVSVPDVSVYEFVQHGSDIWKISPGIKKIGTVYKMQVTREA